MGKFEEALEKLKALVEVDKEFLNRLGGTLHLEYVAGIICPVLRGVLDDLCRRIEERHKIEYSPQDQVHVTHYTSIAALVSMFQDASRDNGQSSLRLYDSEHLNDPNEGNYITQNLPQKHKWLEQTDVRHAYMASFMLPKNEEDVSNNLVYWRTYGMGGEGCSLSLRAPLSRLRKVFYGSEKVKRTAKELWPVLDLLGPLLEANNPSLRKCIQEKLAETVWEPLEKIRYLYKGEAYEYENECRFVILQSDIEKDDICFEYQDRNNSPARIRHYYEHKDLCITRLLPSGSLVTLGPCVPYRENVRYCIETLKSRIASKHKTAGFGPEIRVSEISYRRT